MRYRPVAARSNDTARKHPVAKTSGMCRSRMKASYRPAASESTSAITSYVTITSLLASHGVPQRGGLAPQLADGVLQRGRRGGSRRVGRRGLHRRPIVRVAEAGVADPAHALEHEVADLLRVGDAAEAGEVQVAPVVAALPARAR